MAQSSKKRKADSLLPPPVEQCLAGVFIVAWLLNGILHGAPGLPDLRSEAIAAIGKTSPISLVSTSLRIIEQSNAAAVMRALPLTAPPDTPIHHLVAATPLTTRGPSVPRVGWQASPLNHAIDNWDDAEFIKRLRVSRDVFEAIVSNLTASGHVRDNRCNNPKFRVPARFKCAVGLLHLAHGGSWWQTGFAAGISEAAAYNYTVSFCSGVIDVLREQYMRKPTQAELVEVQDRFCLRRGMGNVGAAVDGTHVPWQPDLEEYMEDYHNYKGWYSILCVACVNSFYMFVDAEVGRPGRMSDSTATQLSYFYNEMLKDSDSWLGPDGLLLSDGACGIGDFIMTPYPGTQLTNKQQYFNFCLSSTRMFVEQTFGMWKSRWRVLIKEQVVSHETMSLMIYATMILHNVCMVHGNGWGIDYMTDGGLDLLEFMQNYPWPRCQKCKDDEVLHCTHKNYARTVDVRSRAGRAMERRREEMANKLWHAEVERVLALGNDDVDIEGDELAAPREDA